jgi:ribosome biogenesis GTPase A
MKTLLGSIDLVIECRDYRVPLTSRNPLFEKSLEGKERVVVYTHRDLGGILRDRRQEEIIQKWHTPVEVLFTGQGEGSKKSIGKVLDCLRERAGKKWKLVGHRVMVVGMPNVGKSTLLNALRGMGVGKGKVAITGAQPGVTRKISTGVKIIPSEDDEEGRDGGGNGKAGKGVGGGVYLLDTPGVFIPYVPDSEAMMKLALCGSVKDTIISPVMLADYLLYQINRFDPSLYREYSFPTNEITDLLEAMAAKTGRLGKGGKPDFEAVSLWMIQQWRTGRLGRFLLDDVTPEALEKSKMHEEGMMPSISQARKAETERRRERGRARKMAG